MTVMGPDGAMHVQPHLPVHAMKSYVIVSPPRPATCEEAGCAAWAHGWVTAVDEATELGQRQAAYIRGDRSRGHTERRRDDGATEFTFTAGQRCYARHTLPWEGRERFAERGGDWRGNPRGEVRQFTRADDWVESFAEHQNRLAEALKRG